MRFCSCYTYDINGLNIIVFTVDIIFLWNFFQKICYIINYAFV